MSLSIVVPFAGESVFSTIADKPLLYHVMSKLPESDSLIILTREELENRVIPIAESIDSKVPIVVKTFIHGSSRDSTMDALEQVIDPDDSLLMVSPYKLLGLDYGLFLYICESADGGIVTVRDTFENCRKVMFDGSGFVSHIVGEDPVGEDISCDIFYWRKASFLTTNMRKLSKKFIVVDFYHSFNEMIAEGAHVIGFRADREQWCWVNPKRSHAN